MPLSVEQVLSIARVVEAYDGVAPLDEATLLTLRHHPERVRIWGDVRGFGLLVSGSEAATELSLVVLPAHRGTGLGRQLLLQGAQKLGLPAGTTAWSHGDNPAAAALARRYAWERSRELWVMRRSTVDLPPLQPVPENVWIAGLDRTDDRVDVEEVLRVNAAAFAHHPEQGSLDATGMAERMAEPWFDPDGLILAWGDAEGRSDVLLGFHWTKRHSATEGEVYVVGVDPAAQGRGLGRLLTLAGLHHLADSGVEEIHLYVEADNTPAVRLYTGLGFTHTRADTHVQYTHG